VTETGWLITHDRCLDGATAALLAEAANLHPLFVEPDRVVPAIAGLSSDHPVYLADVSIPLADWDTYGERITWLLDHHQSALRLSTKPRVTIDLSRSGAHLWYDFVVEQGWVKPSPGWQRLVYAVERYDLWKPRHADGENLNRLFHANGWDWYRHRFSAGWVPYTPAEADQLAHLIAEERAFVARHVKEAEWRSLPDGLRLAGVVLESEGPVNQVSHQLIERGADLVLTIKPDGRISARSSSRVDAAKVMEKNFQGGGHARAAGGRLATGESTPTALQEALDTIAAYLKSAPE